MPMMLVDNEIRVKSIRKEFPKREREVIREAVTLNQEKVDELRNAVQSNSPRGPAGALGMLFRPGKRLIP
jgi:hypothetical protein